MRESESEVGSKKSRNPESEFKKLELRSRESESIKQGTSESESEKLRPWCRSRELEAGVGFERAETPKLESGLGLTVR